MYVYIYMSIYMYVLHKPTYKTGGHPGHPKPHPSAPGNIPAKIDQSTRLKDLGGLMMKLMNSHFPCLNHLF